jgi:hypothetical protein
MLLNGDLHFLGNPWKRFGFPWKTFGFAWILIWICLDSNLDFLGFSRPNQAFSVGYADPPAFFSSPLAPSSSCDPDCPHTFPIKPRMWRLGKKMSVFQKYGDEGG